MSVSTEILAIMLLVMSTRDKDEPLGTVLEELLYKGLVYALTALHKGPWAMQE